MLLDRKPLIYLWGPIHKALFQGIAWPFLGRVKSFFFLETTAELNTIRRSTERIEEAKRLTDAKLTAIQQALDDQNARLISLDRQNSLLIERLTALESEQGSQWNNLAKLLLCIFQQPKASSFPESGARHVDPLIRRTRSSAPSDSHG